MAVDFSKLPDKTVDLSGLPDQAPSGDASPIDTLRTPEGSPSYIAQMKTRLGPEAPLRPEPATYSDAYREGGGFGVFAMPNKVTAAATAAGVPDLPPATNVGGRIVKTALQFPGQVADFLTSPEGAAIAATAAVSAPAAVATELGFTADQIDKMIHAGTLEEVVSNALGLLTVGAAHVARFGKAKTEVPEAGKPTTEAPPPPTTERGVSNDLQPDDEGEIHFGYPEDYAPPPEAPKTSQQPPLREEDYAPPPEPAPANTNTTEPANGITQPEPVYEAQAKGEAAFAAEQAEAERQSQLRQKRSNRATPSDGGFSEDPLVRFIIDDVGGILSQSAAQRKLRGDFNSDLYADKPAWADPRHGKVYNPDRGQLPDVVAQAAADLGLLPDGAASPELWAYLQRASNAAASRLKMERGARLDEQKATRAAKAAEVVQKHQNREFQAAVAKQTPGERPINASTLQVGDAVKIAGEDFKVTDIDPDSFDVTLEDGAKFGVQHVADGQVFYGEHEATGEVSPDFVPEPQPEPIGTTAAIAEILKRNAPSPTKLEEDVANAMKKQKAEAAGFTFEQPESPEEQTARVERERQQNESLAQQQADKDKLQHGWQQKKTGDTGDLGQADMFGGGDLFAEEPKKPFGRARIDSPDESGSVPLPGPKATRPAGAPIGANFGSGRYRASYRVNKEVGDKMNALAAAPESASLRAEIAYRNITAGLSKFERDLVGKYLVSERLRSVNPEHPQILSLEQTRQILARKNVKRAIDRYAADVKPEIETLRKRAGLSASAAAGKSPEFISLIATSDEFLPEPGTLPLNPPIALQSKTTRFAKHAGGMAKSYETDLKTVLQKSFVEVTRKVRLRDLYETLKKNGLASNTPVDQIQGVPAQPLPFGRAKKGAEGVALPEVTWIPRAVADNLRDVMEKRPQSSGAILTGAKALQRTITGAALTANPAEILNHMRRQLNVVSAIPSAHAGGLARLTEALVPYFGPKFGTFARVLATDMDLPENQRILQDIFDAGGGSSRGFKAYQAKLPIVRNVQNATHKLLFGVPEGRGVSGWDLRMRVQLEKIRRAVEGNVDPQRIREFANQIGQYTDKPDWIIDAVRHVNPYAATTLPLRVTELKQLAGGSGLKYSNPGKAILGRAETFLRGAGGTLLALTAANYMLSGKFPWQNDKGHEFDLNTGQRDSDGKRVYVKLRALAPELSRPLDTFSAPVVLREREAGKKASYGSAALVGPANQVMGSLGGPATTAAATALTGYAPYLTKSPGKKPEFLDIAGPDKNFRGAMKDRGLRQVVAALRGVNPIGATISPEEKNRVRRKDLRRIEEPLPGVRPFGTVFSRQH